MMERLNRTAALVATFAALGMAGIAEAQTGYTFEPIVPCRVVDTRFGTLPNGGGPVSTDPNNPRLFAMRGNCGVPTAAVAVSVTLTAVTPPSAGFLSIWTAGVPWPNVSNLNFSGGEVAVANGAVVKLGPTMGQDLACFAGASAPTHVIIDVVGYYQ